MMAMWAYVASLFQSVDTPHYTLIVSLVLALLSLFLGFGFYVIEKISPKAHRYLFLGIAGGFLLSFIGAYLLFDIQGVVDVSRYFLNLGVYLFLWGMPIIGAYGVWKGHRRAILISSVGMMVLYFLSRVPTSYGWGVDNVWLFVFFIILFIAYVEGATSGMFFSEVVEKLAPQGTVNSVTAKKFNLVVSSYLFFLLAALLIGVVFSASIFFLNEVFLSVQSSEFFNIRVGSLVGLYLFVGLTVVSVILFWLITPVRKAREAHRFQALMKHHQGK